MPATLWLEEKATHPSPTAKDMNLKDMNLKIRYALLLTFVAVPLVNFILPPLLSDGSQFTNMEPTRIAAAGYAFAIWGVIFTGMVWFSAAIAFGKEPDSLFLTKAMLGLIVAGIASIAFVPISIYCGSTVVLVDIAVHLIALVFAAFELRRHVDSVATSPPGFLARASWFGPSMYLGWISAATVISVSLMAQEWDLKLGESLATSVAIATLILLGCIALTMLMSVRLRDPIYAGTVCWALIAVGVKQVSFPAIQWSAWTVAGIVFLTLVWRLTKANRFYATSQLSNLATEEQK
jgi:hypothetical protein